MFKTLFAFAIAGLCSTASFGATVEFAKVQTVRGAMVNVALNIPEKLEGKAAAVVIAPGQGYHMDLPIVRGLAEKLADQGFIAVRFNWNYYSTDPLNGQPSADLSKEVEDMKAVVDFARSDARIDASQVILAGKSLGTLVSYQVFTKDSAAKGLILMTPICTARYDDNDQPLPVPAPAGPQNYPGFASITKPIAMVLGNADPLCSLPMLYDFLKDTKGNVSVDVIGGDHGWNVTKGTDPDSTRRNSQNIAQGVAMAAHWIGLLLGK